MEVKSPVLPVHRVQKLAEPRMSSVECVAATKIQSLVRQFLAKRLLKAKKAEKKTHEETIICLEHEAYARSIQIYQEQVAKEREKEAEDRRRQKEMVQRQKRMLEAAFEGDNAEKAEILKGVRQLGNTDGVVNDRVSVVDCVDANCNTPLSEAASGGHADTINLLIQNGADPNSRGQFQRTPLYRAAFGGHIEAVQTLLRGGADPRLYAGDGQTPGQQTSFESIRTLLDSWDISVTETILAKLEADRQSKHDERLRSGSVHVQKLEDDISRASGEYEDIQKKFLKTTEDLNERVSEYRNAVASGNTKNDVILQLINDTEIDVEMLRDNVDQVYKKLTQLRKSLKDELASTQDSKFENCFECRRVQLKELGEVLLKDAGDAIKTSAKWPRIIDCSGRAATFLRYRDTNFLNALCPHEMQPQAIRLALLGSLRYGKPLVIDMMGIDMFEACERKFNEVCDGLMQSIMNKNIMEAHVYEELIVPGDSPEYSKEQFVRSTVERFRFFIIAKTVNQSPKLLHLTYPITVVEPIVRL